MSFYFWLSLSLHDDTDTGDVKDHAISVIQSAWQISPFLYSLFSYLLDSGDTKLEIIAIIFSSIIEIE